MSRSIHHIQYRRREVFVGVEAEKIYETEAANVAKCTWEEILILQLLMAIIECYICLLSTCARYTRIY